MRSMIRICAVLSIAGLSHLVWADEAVSLFRGGEEVGQYGSVSAAFNALTGSGDEVVRLNANVEEPAAVIGLNCPLTLDLNGCKLTKTSSGQLFRLFSGAVGFTVKNGEIDVPNSLVETWYWYWEGHDFSETMTVTNCTITGECLVWAGNGTYLFADCVIQTKYLISSGCTAPMTGIFRDCVLAPTENPTDNQNDGYFINGGQGVIETGYMTFDPTPWAQDGVDVTAVSETVGGVACSYKVSLSQDVVATVYDAEGAVIAPYPSLSQALSAAPEGGKVVVAEDVVVAHPPLAIARSMTVDMGGHAVSCEGHNLFEVADGTAVTVCNGTASSTSSVFVPAGATSVVTVDNCTVNGYCLVYGAGLLVVRNSRVYTTALGSSGGSAVVELEDGFYAFGVLQHAGIAGTRFVVRGGRFSTSPLVDSRTIVADGLTMVVDKQTIDGHDYLANVIPASEAESVDYEAELDGLKCASFRTALENSRYRTVKLLKNLDGGGTSFSVGWSWNDWRTTIDLNGHDLTNWGDTLVIQAAAVVTVKNGSLSDYQPNTSCVGHAGGGQLILENVTLFNTSSGEVNGIWLPGNETVVEATDCTFNVNGLISANWSGGCRLNFRGGCVMTGDRIGWSNDAPVGQVCISGGWWAIDPGAYLADASVAVDCGSAATPARYRVFDTAADEWSVDFSLPTGKAATKTIPARTGPIAVRFDATRRIPGSRTLIVDLSDVSVEGGASVEFALVGDSDRHCRLEFDGGRLYGWLQKGFVVMVR